MLGAQNSNDAAVSNLENVLEHLQLETESERQRWNETMSSNRLEIGKLQTELSSAKLFIEEAEKTKGQAATLVKQLEAKETTFNLMKVQVEGMKRTLEDMVSRVNDDNLVDRRIVVRLLLAYFEETHAKRSTSSGNKMFHLLGTVLRLTEQERERLKQAIAKINTSSGGWFTSNDSGWKASLSELWVAFLLFESDASDKQPFNPVAIAASQPKPTSQ